MFTLSNKLVSTNFMKEKIKKYFATDKDIKQAYEEKFTGYNKSDKNIQDEH